MIARVSIVGALCCWLVAACSGGTTQRGKTSPGDGGDGNQTAGSAGTDTTATSAGSSGTGGAGGSSGGSHAGQGSGGTPINITGDFAHDYAQAVCELLTRCYAGLPTPGQDCVAFFEGTFRDSSLPPIDAAVAAGSIAYHADATKACIQQVAAAACDWTTLDTCFDVWVGKLQTGESCSLNLECADGYCASEGQCPGTCALRGQAGDTCTASSCADGLKCIFDLQDAGHCVKGVGLGETCSATQPCRGYTVCAGLGNDAASDTGTCATRASLRTVKQGELCESLDDLLCEENLVCTTTLENGIVVGRCQPKAKSGAACTYSTPDPCPSGEYCHISSATGVKPATGECRKAPLVGEECRYGTVYSASCPADAYCDTDSKVCALTKALGDACSKASDCASRSCNDGKCTLNLDCGSDN